MSIERSSPGKDQEESRAIWFANLVQVIAICVFISFGLERRRIAAARH